MKTEHKQKESNLTGLEAYNEYNVWLINKDRDFATLSLAGIIISVKWSAASEGLARKYQNSFVVNVQYDYKNPDFLHSFDFVKHSGTYGITLFSKTLEGAMIKAEKYINGNFEGVKDFHTQKIVSKTKLPIKEVAKYAFLHHYSRFTDLANKDFRMVALRKDAKTYAEYLEHIQRYQNREKADYKYDVKLKKAFKKEFSAELSKYQNFFKFNILLFAKHLGIKTIKDLPKYRRNLISKIIEYYNI